MPSVLERLNLRVGLRAVLLGEQDVVVGVGVERRVEVDQVDRLILDVAAEDVEVVAVVENVLRDARRRQAALRRRPSPANKSLLRG